MEKKYTITQFRKFLSTCDMYVGSIAEQLEDIDSHIEEYNKEFPDEVDEQDIDYIEE